MIIKCISKMTNEIYTYLDFNGYKNSSTQHECQAYLRIYPLFDKKKSDTKISIISECLD